MCYYAEYFIACSYKMSIIHMKKFLVVCLSLVFLLSAKAAFGAVSCQPVYGGGQNCITLGNVLINKTVQNPLTNQFVDNLGTNDPKFIGNQTVTFQLTITNTGSTTILQTQVKDIFPSHVNFVSGSGSFDNNTKTLSFLVDNLAPNETRTFTLQGKVIDPKNLPDGTTCVVNQASATTNTGQMSQDNSQLCIQKQPVTTKGGLPVLPPTKAVVTPPTGPEMLGLIGLLPAGLSGWFLRKKSKSNFRGGEK